jgi:hypothetical protein
MLYQSSVPVFLRYLAQLQAFIDIAEEHTHSTGIPESEILNARLAPDMLPFETQIKIAASFTLRASYPLAGELVPPYDDSAVNFPSSFDGLRDRLLHTAALLRVLSEDSFKDSASRTLVSQAGNATLSLPAQEFLLQYALPNFFFHVTTAYAILRHLGVKIGKMQFDGFHGY